jgi:ketosteroid isomerase-like protein
MKRFLHFLVTSYIVLFSNCNSQSSAEVDKVKATLTKLIEADNRSDIKTVLSCYTDNIELYPVGAQTIVGIENVRANYEKLFASFKLSIITTMTEVKVVGMDAYVKGYNVVDKKSLTDSTVQHQTDQYIAWLIKLPDGEWKVNKLLWGFK